MMPVSNKELPSFKKDLRLLERKMMGTMSLQISISR